MDAIEKRANGVALNGLDEQRLRNHQLRMMRRAWLKDMMVRKCSLFIRLCLENKQNINTCNASRDRAELVRTCSCLGRHYITLRRNLSIE